MGRWVGLIVALLAAVALLIALGEDGERMADAPVPPPTLAPPAEPSTTTAPAADEPVATTTTTAPAAPEPAAGVQPLRTPEDARELLEAEGIDPATLSKEIAEVMERRFERKPE